jgi:hypothetical protein
MRKPGRYTILTVVTVAVTAAATGAALAAWHTDSDSAAAAARTGVLPQGAVPESTVGSGAGTVRLRWAAAPLGSHATAGYLLKRYPAAGGAAQAVGAGCAGTIDGTSCVESAVPNGSWRWTVTPVRGGWRGPESDPSAQFDVYAGPPAIEMAHPADGGGYGVASGLAASTTAGCANAFCGTVLHGASGPVTVTLTVRRESTGKYWSGSAFTAQAATELPATLRSGGTAGGQPGAPGAPGGGAATDAWWLSFPMAGFPANGGYTIRVTARDDQGGTAAITRHVTMYPETPKPPTIDAKPASPTGQTSATLGFSHPLNTGNADPGDDVAFECSLDGAAFADCASPMIYGGQGVGALPEGLHGFAVRARDRGGNLSQVAGYPWVVGMVRPTAASVKASNGTGTAGLVDAGDKLVFGYSKAIDPGSVRAGWNGAGAVAVTVRLWPGAAGHGDTIDVYDGAIRLASIGTVDLGQVGHVAGAATGVIYQATLSINNARDKLTVTVGAPDNAAATATVGTPGSMAWAPGLVRDPAGNTLNNPAPVLVAEAGPPDVDF